MTTTIPAPSGFTDTATVWQRLLADATDDVKGIAPPHVAASLREPQNLIRWHRALATLDGDVNSRMGDDRLRTEAAKPEVEGTPEFAAWKQEKRLQGERHARRVRFRSAVSARMRECRFLLAENDLHERVTAESLLETIARAADYIERDDPDTALSLLDATLRDAEKAVRSRSDASA